MPCHCYDLQETPIIQESAAGKLEAGKAGGTPNAESQSPPQSPGSKTDAKTPLLGTGAASGGEGNVQWLSGHAHLRYVGNGYVGNNAHHTHTRIIHMHASYTCTHLCFPFAHASAYSLAWLADTAPPANTTRGLSVESGSRATSAETQTVSIETVACAVQVRGLDVWSVCVHAYVCACINVHGLLP